MREKLLTLTQMQRLRISFVENSIYIYPKDNQ